MVCAAVLLLALFQAWQMQQAAPDASLVRLYAALYKRTLAAALLNVWPDTTAHAELARGLQVDANAPVRSGGDNCDGEDRESPLWIWHSRHQSAQGLRRAALRCPRD